MYILGQLCGVIGAIVSIFKPLFRKKIHILMCVLIINVMCTLNFVLIGKVGAAAFVCMVAILQATISIIHEYRETDISVIEKVIFLFLYVGFGLLGVVTAEGFAWELSWKNALELMPVIGALMLMFSVFAKTVQHTRYFLLLNGLLWLVYNAIVGVATVFTNFITVCSTSYAIWKYREPRTSTDK